MKQSHCERKRKTHSKYEIQFHTKSLKNERNGKKWKKTLFNRNKHSINSKIFEQWFEWRWNLHSSNCMTKATTMKRLYLQKEYSKTQCECMKAIEKTWIQIKNRKKKKMICPSKNYTFITSWELKQMEIEEKCRKLRRKSMPPVNSDCSEEWIQRRRNL